MKLLVLTQLVLGLQAAQLVLGAADDWLTTCGNGQDARKTGGDCVQSGAVLMHTR
jgi:hypothetical protein